MRYIYGKKTQIGMKIGNIPEIHEEYAITKHFRAIIIIIFLLILKLRFFYLHQIF
jgi:hypothetical protein